MRSLARLYRYIWPYRWWTALALMSMMVVALSNGGLVALTRPLFDDVLTRQSETVEAPRAEETDAALNIFLRR
ncbi:MAG: hypothetical protein R3338_14400, partial [Thermoanaerobaculia bacterium]|nr:hypothetical protein [Thermoanaerobaculia bacterium]